tara:strand:- start:564 stop:815 length:252 start_codon:yes stop_codon:yes gene_type:complete
MFGNPPGLQAADGLIDRLIQGLRINPAKEALAVQAVVIGKRTKIIGSAGQCRKVISSKSRKTEKLMKECEKAGRAFSGLKTGD